MKTKTLMFGAAIFGLFAFPSCSPTSESQERRLESSLNTINQDF